MVSYEQMNYKICRFRPRLAYAPLHGNLGCSLHGARRMKQFGFLFFFVFLGFLIVTPSTHFARAQDYFSSGDSDSGGGGPSNENFSSGDDGNNGGPSNDSFGGSPRYRPLPGYTNCGPWYNSYSNFVRAMMQHYGGWCQVRNGNQVWCHARKAGNCNPDATGGQPNSPILDTGMRYTPNCQSVCDRTVAEGGHYEPVPMTRTRTPPVPPPCEMPSVEQLAQPPDDGAIAVAYALPPDDGDVAVAEALPPDDGDIAVALALPAPVTLSGGATKAGVFMAPSPPVRLTGGVSENQNSTPPQKPVRLRGFLTKSLRVPITYKPSHPKPLNTSPQFKQQETKVLQGSAGTYSADVGKERFMEGLREGMLNELKQLARQGQEKKVEDEQKLAKKREKLLNKQCEIKGSPSPVFGELNPKKNVGEVGKFIIDIFNDGIAEEKKTRRLYKLKKIPLIGPIFGGLDFVTSYVETFQTLMERDKRIRDAMENSAGHDLDPRDVGYIAGQDLADAYQVYLKGSFAF